MSAPNRFEQIAQKTTKVFNEVVDSIKENRGGLLYATGMATYIGLLLYRPGPEAHPLLVGAKDVAEFVNTVQDTLEAAGATETVKTLGELAISGGLHPLFTTKEGLRTFVHLQFNSAEEVFNDVVDGCQAVGKLVHRGLRHLQLVKDRPELLFAVADSLPDGLAGVFRHGTEKEFQREWMAGDGLVFQVGGGRGPVLATRELVAAADDMSAQMYRNLQAGKEWLERGGSRPGAIVPRDDAAYGDVCMVLAMAPWELDPQNGLVRLSPAPLDISKPLYDDAGFEHSLVQASQAQVVTRIYGCYGVWDRKTGECLLRDCEGAMLSNKQPDPETLMVLRNTAAETLADLHAQAAIERARKGPAAEAERNEAPEL